MNRIIEANQKAYLQAETARLEPLFHGLDLTPGLPKECPVCGTLTHSWLNNSGNKAPWLTESEDKTISLLNIESTSKSLSISLQEAVEKYRTTYTCHVDRGEFTADHGGAGTTTFIVQPDGRSVITCPSPIHERATAWRKLNLQSPGRTPK